jgi:hypothetical protein
VPAAQAVATGAMLRDSVASAENDPAVLYGASLTGDAVALGLWQRAASALNGDTAASRHVRVVRRSTGGPTVCASEGVVYFALALRHASVLMSCPKDRVLNRNVRGFLGGLSLGGEPAHYFGREYLSVARRPAALVAWDRLADGRVLIEVFASHTKSFVPDAALDGYPEPSEPRFLGKDPILLAEAWGGERSIEQIVRWVAESHPSRFGADVTIDRSSLTDAERAHARARTEDFLWQANPDEDALVWSELHPIPIGWLSAGARLDGNGTLADVRIAGDFFQDHDAPSALHDKLAGKPRTAELYASSVNATWDGATHVIEGVKSLDPILKALLEAAPV